MLISCPKEGGIEWQDAEDSKAKKEEKKLPVSKSRKKKGSVDSGQRRRKEKLRAKPDWLKAWTLSPRRPKLQSL
jgi:hypothetical protein